MDIKHHMAGFPQPQNFFCWPCFWQFWSPLYRSFFTTFRENFCWSLKSRVSHIRIGFKVLRKCGALLYGKSYIIVIWQFTVIYDWDQATLGRQRVTLIGSRTQLDPSMDPAMALQYTQYGPLYIGYIFAFYATKMGSRDSGDTKVHPHWV